MIFSTFHYMSVVLLVILVPISTFYYLPVLISTNQYFLLLVCNLSVGAYRYFLLFVILISNFNRQYSSVASTNYYVSIFLSTCQYFLLSRSALLYLTWYKYFSDCTILCISLLISTIQYFSVFVKTYRQLSVFFCILHLFSVVNHQFKS